MDERISPPLESHLAGEAPLGKDINEATTEGAHKAELLAAPILIIVLCWSSGRRSRPRSR